jgi:hypothetical protein
MSQQKILYLSKADVASTGVTMKEIIDALLVAFREHGEGKVEMPPKPGVHTRPDAFIHAMPAYIPALQSVGMKWVSGYPENFKRGLPYITGLMILNDDDTGIPLAVMDCTWITGMRTGAATAVAAKYLARPESESVGILGALQRKFLERIKASTERIGGLIDDLIQITTMEMGALEIKPEPLDLDLIIDNAMAYTSTQVREKNISIRLDIANAPPHILADRESFQQILIHLLQNASSATDRKSVV